MQQYVAWRYERVGEFSLCTMAWGGVKFSMDEVVRKGDESTHVLWFFE